MNTRTIREVRDGSGRLGRLDDALLEVVAPVPQDGDADGMPDGWEVDRGLDPADPTDAADDRDGDGYTNVEEYLNELAAMRAP